MSHGHGHCCCCVEGSVVFSPRTDHLPEIPSNCTTYSNWAWLINIAGATCNGEDWSGTWYLDEWDSGASTGTEETWQRLSASPHATNGLTITLVCSKSTGGGNVTFAFKSLTFATPAAQLVFILDPLDPTRIISSTAGGGLQTCCQATGLSIAPRLMARRWQVGTLPDFSVTLAGFTGGCATANDTYTLTFDHDAGTENIDGYRYPDSDFFVGSNANWSLTLEVDNRLAGIDTTLATLTLNSIPAGTTEQFTLRGCRDYDSATWSLSWDRGVFPPCPGSPTITAITEV